MPRILCLIVEGPGDRYFFEHWVWPKVKDRYASSIKPMILLDNKITFDALNKRVRFTDGPFPTKLSEEKIKVIEEMKSRSEIIKIFKAPMDTDGLDEKRLILKDNDSPDPMEHKKRGLMEVYPFLKEEDIAIAVTELESWVIAGFGPSSKYGGPFISCNPEELNKERVLAKFKTLGLDFDECEEKYFINLFLKETLIEERSEFDFKYALERSPSFKLFVQMLRE